MKYQFYIKKRRKERDRETKRGMIKTVKASGFKDIIFKVNNNYSSQ